jgi:energy-coupling factor transporter transmembrane protein EcfT
MVIIEGMLPNTALYILTALSLAIVFIQKVFENNLQFAMVTIVLTIAILTIAGLYVRKYMNSIAN